MGASRRVVAVAAVTASALAACDALIGLDKYQDVACAFGDCGADAADTGPRPDVVEASPFPDVVEGGIGGDADSSADGDAGDGTLVDVVDADVVVVTEGGPVVPAPHEVWAHWPMPNPDAAIAPDSSTPLPHTMTYDAGPEGGTGPVYDAVTTLTWSRTTTTQVTSPKSAWDACKALPGTWRVPTRIELVSLIDFTQPSGQPTIDPAAFPNTPADTFWTSSPVPGPDGGPIAYWTVSFATGLTANGGSANNVRCVSGGTQ